MFNMPMWLIVVLSALAVGVGIVFFSKKKYVSSDELYDEFMKRYIKGEFFAKASVDELHGDKEMTYKIREGRGKNVDV